MDSGIGIGGLLTGNEEFVRFSFDLFTPIEVENSILKAYTFTYCPISSTSDAGPFNFEIPADPEKFTDSESIGLHGAIRIREKQVQSTQKLPQLLFKQVGIISWYLRSLSLKFHKDPN